MLSRSTRVTLLLFTLWTAGSAMAAPARLSGSGFAARIDANAFSYYTGSSSEADLVYSLSAVTVGGERMGLPRVPTIVEDGGIVRRYYGDSLSESFTLSESGVEMSWLIADRPKAAGPIVIEGRLLSPHTPVRAGRGWRFVDSDGRAVFTYGEVTVIDSLGRTVSGTPEISEGMLRIEVPAEFVAAAQFPVLVDPVVGPETAVCPQFDAAPGLQENIEIAGGSQGCLAVWQDSRSDNGTDIFATRLSATGEPLDSTSIAVSTATGDQTDPVVAWNGADYLVVWADKRNGNPHIYASRVRANGEVVDRQGLLLSGDKGVQAYPRVASDGSNWLVVWQDTRGSSPDVYGCSVTRDGVVGKAYGLSTRLDNEEMPDVAWNQTSYLVVWRDYRNFAASGTDIIGGRVARNGIRMAGDILVSCDSTGNNGIAGDQVGPRLCQLGSSCMAVWEDYRNGSTSDLYGARINSAGTVMDRNGILISNRADNQELASVGYNGTYALAVWRDRSDRLLRGARITTAGSVVDYNAILISAGMAGSAGSSTCGCGSRFIVGWNNIGVTESDTLVTSVTNNGGVVSQAGWPVSLSLCRQHDYSVADNGSGYAVVWSQMVNGRYKILGALVSYAGQVLSSAPVNITSGISGDQTQPAIAWNGSRYLLVWRGNESFSVSAWDIRGCVLNTSLQPTTQAISVCTIEQDQARPCAVSNGSGFFVAWEDSRTAVSPYYYTDVYGAVVASNGAVTPASAVIGAGTGNQLRPRAASDGSAYFCVWEDYRNGYPLVYGAKVTSSGSVLTAKALPATSYNQTAPDICFANGTYFAVWSDYYNITGCRISTAGAITDTAGITIDAGTKTKLAPGICWDGTSYQVVWEDYRSSFSGNADVYHATVGADGAVAPGPKTGIVCNLSPQYMPRVYAHGADGVMFYDTYFNYADSVMLVHLSQQDAQPVSSIAQAKSLPAGSTVALDGKIVTAVFTDCFYIEDADRASGIKVISGATVQVGDVVTITGTVGISDGERQVSSGAVGVMGVSSQPLAPLGMRCDSMGGAALNGYTPGITGAYGANNVGLLVRTWGRVISTGSGYFYIQDVAPVGVKVRLESGTMPKVGSVVCVTGISTCEVVAGGLSRVIRARQSGDLRLIQ